MSVEVLFLSRDLALSNVIRAVCEDTGIALRLATESAQAEQLLANSKFDGLIADCDDVPGAVPLVQKLRRGVSNRSAIIFIIRSGSGISVRQAFELGASFVLDKPVNAERAGRCLRAAHGLLVRERRRYFRLPCEIPVDVTLGDGSKITATSANISEGGLSIRCPQPIPSGKIKASFTLPDTRRKIEAKAEIAWALGTTDRYGIQFTYLSDECQQELTIWLNSELQRVDPVLLFNANRGWTRVKEAVASAD